MEIALSPDQIANHSEIECWRSLKAVAEENGIAITNLHLGNPKLNPNEDMTRPTLLDTDPDRRNVWVDYLGQAARIAEKLDCPYVTVASGPPNENLNDSESWELLTQTLREGLESIPDGRTLLLEHEPEHFVRGTDDLIALHEKMEGRVLVNLDVGHLEVMREPLGPSIVRLGALIRNVHLEDIKDHRHRHLLPGDGDVDFDEILAALAEIRYRGPLTADLYPFAESPVVALDRAFAAFSKWPEALRRR